MDVKEPMEVKELNFSVATVNTDAGFYPNEKMASYAFYIRCGDMMSKGSGVFKGLCKSPLEAEMKSVINAMHILLNSDVKFIDRIILNTDNTKVAALRNGDPLQRKLYQYVGEIRRTKGRKGINNGKFFEIRHVKAHSGTATKRQFVNDWCDKECTRQLREWKQKKILRLKINEVAKSFLKD